MSEQTSPSMSPGMSRATSPDLTAEEDQSPLLVCSRASYACRIAYDIAAIEASFQIAEIEALRDNQ